MKDRRKMCPKSQQHKNSTAQIAFRKVTPTVGRKLWKSPKTEFGCWTLSLNIYDETWRFSFCSSSLSCRGAGRLRLTMRLCVCVCAGVVGCGCAGAAAGAVRVIWRSAQATLLALASRARSLSRWPATLRARALATTSDCLTCRRESGRASRGDLRRGGPSDPSTGAAEADPRRMRRAPSSPLEKNTHTYYPRRVCGCFPSVFHPVHIMHICAFMRSKCSSSLIVKQE